MKALPLDLMRAHLDNLDEAVEQEVQKHPLEQQDAVRYSLQEKAVFRYVRGAYLALLDQTQPDPRNIL